MMDGKTFQCTSLDLKIEEHRKSSLWCSNYSDHWITCLIFLTRQLDYHKVKIITCLNYNCSRAHWNYEAGDSVHSGADRGDTGLLGQVVMHVSLHFPQTIGWQGFHLFVFKYIAILNMQCSCAYINEFSNFIT